MRPGAFAYNTIRLWGETIRRESVVRSPYGDARIAPMHEADIAAVAVTALLDDGHAGAKYVLTGPESLSQREQVEIIGKATGRTIRFEELTEEQAERDGVPTMPLDYLRSAVGAPCRDPADDRRSHRPPGAHFRRVGRRPRRGLPVGGGRGARPTAAYRFGQPLFAGVVNGCTSGSNTWPAAGTLRSIR